jgi:peptide/nickel transport system substrate-binding protein
MIINERKRRRQARWLIGWFAVAIAAVAWTGASTAQTNSARHSVAGGGTITTSITGTPAAASAPNWLLPVITLSTFTGANIGAQQMLWRPLITYTNNLKIDFSHSVARSAHASGDGKSILVNLNPKWKWSDGKPVTSKDVLFDWNLIKASCPSLAKCQYGAATSIFPFSVTALKIVSPTAFRIVLSRPFNTDTWMRNHLILFSPLPAHVMTRNPATGKVYCRDLVCNKAKDAAAEYAFLSSVANKPTNKVWSVVDGPWKLGPWIANQSYTFLRNDHYTGGPRAKAAKLVWEYFTSDQAEFNALKAGQLDIGYIPLAQAPATLGGYTTYRFHPLLAEFINVNQGSLTDPKAPARCTRAICAMLNMLPVRQALQMAIDQNGWVKSIFHGFALPHCSTIAPVPTTFYGPYRNYCPYGFNLDQAKATLERAGFALQGGTMTYEGATGANLPPKGAQLAFTLGYPTGDTIANQEALLWQANLKKIGVNLSLKQIAFDTLLGQTNQGKANVNAWDASNLANLWYLYPNIVPTGDIDYTCEGGGNFGGYCDPKMTQLVDNQLYKQGLASTYAYVKYAAEQLPGMLNIPTPDSLVAIKTTVSGFSDVQLNPAFSPVPYPELLTVR